MKIEPDPFEQLTKLLALKKHEKPPPGYFGDFAGRVLARIEAAREAQGLTWWQRLAVFFEFKPAFAYASGMGVSAALLLGLLLSFNAGSTTQPMPEIEPVTTASIIAPIDQTAESSPSATEPATPFSQLAVNVQRVSFSY